jgi:hypothetical protein
MESEQHYLGCRKKEPACAGLLFEKVVALNCTL